MTMEKVLESVADTHPYLREEWDDERDISVFTSGSGKSVQWKCLDHGHTWTAMVKSRVRGTGCPYCAGRKVLDGFNDLLTTHPTIGSEWDTVKNERDVSTVRSTEKKKAWWVCAKNAQHNWEAIIANRTRLQSGCPYCSGMRVSSGENDLETLYPEIASEWSERNSKLPSEVSPGSHDKYQWECSEGHIWTAAVRNRTRRGDGCTVCSGRKIVSGYNDLATRFPELGKEWDKANSEAADQISPESRQQKKWKCSEGHTWEAVVANRTRNNQGCPHCSGRDTITGETDLEIADPENIEKLVEDKKKTGSLQEDIFTWCCDEDRERKKADPHHEFKGSGQGCEKCNAKVVQAKDEIYDFIKTVVPEGTEIIKNDESLIGDKLDIYVPSVNIAVELNGTYWHTEAGGKGRFYHFNKYDACREHGVKLFTVWEDNWRDRRESVKNMLAHKLNSTLSGKVYARKTYFTRLTGNEAVPFLDAHHLQSGNKSSKHFGLKEKNTDEIVAVMSIRYAKSKGELEIKRFATSKSVPGGFSKLLKGIVQYHIEENTVSNLFSSSYEGAERIVSYSHNDHSWGEVYAKNGFDKIHDGEPGYFYFRNGRREFRLNYSPKRFSERKDLIFKEGLQERELAALNELSRIWDCGSARWEKDIIVDK